MYFSRVKGQKYKNKKVEYQGIKFDSKLEMNYYIFLQDRLNKGQIKDLQLQYRYLLQDTFETHKQFIADKKTFEVRQVFSNKTKKTNLIRKIEYVADFVFFDIKLNKWCVVDTKGFETTDYKIKKKILLRCIPSDMIFIEVKEKLDK